MNNKWVERVLGVTIGILLAGACWSAEDFVVPRVDVAPDLDGSLTDPAWSRAATLDAFTILRQTNVTASTTGKVMMDKAWLYLGFRCANPNMAQIEQLEKKRDEGVTRDESVEIFLDPGSDGALYYQFMLSFANVQADRRFASGEKKDTSWTIPWRSATRKDDQGWTAELALPLSLVKHNGDPSKARMNVARNERQLELDQAGAILAEKRVCSSWGAAHNSYTERAGFRKLAGLDSAQIEEVPLVSLELVNVDGFGGSESESWYTVRILARSRMGANANVKIMVTDDPVAGKPMRAAEKEIALAPFQDVEAEIRVPVASFAQRNVRVAMRSAQTDELLQELILSAPAVFNSMGTPFLDRNYYTTESEARLRQSLGLPGDRLRNLSVVVRLADGNELARLTGPSKEYEIALPLQKVPLGQHELRVGLEDKKGQQMGESLATLVKLAPKPGCEIKIDLCQKMLLKDGAPYFPFGLVVTRPSAPALKELAQDGYNAFQNWTREWRYEGIGSLTQLMDVAQSHGLEVVDNTFGVLNPHLPKGMKFFGIKPASEVQRRELLDTLATGLEKVKPEWEARIRSIMDYPSLLGYYNRDEPNLGNVEASMAGALEFYKTVHATDPYRPVITTFSANIPKEGLAVTDIVYFDIYLKGGSGFFGLRGYPNAVTYHLLKLKGYSDPANKVAMLMLITEGQEPLRCPRLVLPEEQRCQTYLAMIHGVKGLFYFFDTLVYSQLMLDTLADLAQQAKMLAPALLSGESHSVVRYAPVELDIEKEQFPDVQAALFKNPAGGYILLAANSAYHPVDVKFIVPGLHAKAGVKRMFSKQTGGEVSLSGFARIREKIKRLLAGESFNVNVVRDTLEPLGTRAYALELAPDAAKPVALAVETTAHPEQALPLNRYFLEALKDRRNFVPNPSFEISTPPHLLPDWVRPVTFPPIPLLDMPGALLSMDDRNAVHGKYSVRVNIALPAVAENGYGIKGTAYLPVVAKPMPFVMSFYVKATENVKEGYLSGIGIAFDNPGGKSSKSHNFVPTTEWQRIVVRGTYDYRQKTLSNLNGIQFTIGPGRGSLRNGFAPWRDAKNIHAGKNLPYKDEFMTEATGKAEFWVDAVQIEFGEKVTEFTTE